jgi:hypothetical protein
MSRPGAKVTRHLSAAPATRPPPRVTMMTAPSSPHFCCVCDIQRIYGITVLVYTIPITTFSMTSLSESFHDDDVYPRRERGGDDVCGGGVSHPAAAAVTLRLRQLSRSVSAPRRSGGDTVIGQGLHVFCVSIRVVLKCVPPQQRIFHTSDPISC